VLFGTPDSNAPPAAIGNLYAQVGWWGVGFGAFIAGMMFQFIQVFMIRYVPPHPVGISMMAILCFGSFRFSMTSFHSLFLSEAIVPTLFILNFWKLFRRIVYPPFQPQYLSPGSETHMEDGINEAST
jgi:hypothetical protein